VIGRDEEIRCVQPSCAAPKKQPQRSASPAGKTAIGGLAQRIVAGDAPENLRDKVIMSPRHNAFRGRGQRGRS
jgi:ATP-dependent Clp protease ATP-binding subunit ClpB